MRELDHAVFERKVEVAERCTPVVYGVRALQTGILKFDAGSCLDEGPSYFGGPLSFLVLDRLGWRVLVVHSW